MGPLYMTAALKKGRVSGFNFICILYYDALSSGQNSKAFKNQIKVKLYMREEDNLFLISEYIHF